VAAASVIERQERAMMEWAASWSSHDVERLLLVFTPDVVYEDVPMLALNRGIVEVRAFCEKVLAIFPDIAFEVQFSFSNGQHGCVEWIMRGIRNLPGVPAVSKRVEVRGVSVFEFVDDKIRRCSDYWDMATYQRQLGTAVDLS
jgi:steroid delta-isomerase-like uncharacterized protein